MAQGRLAIAGAVALVAACRGHHDEGPPPLGKALAAVIAAADQAQVPWRCAALDTPPLPAATLASGWDVAQQTLKLTTAKPEYTIAFVADAGGSAPPTLAALARLRTRFDGADLVVTLGGMGTTQAELEGTLGTLSDKASWPVVALPGDLEAETQQRAAIAALRAKGDAILDGRQARWIVADGFTIATIPGAGAVQRLVAGADGCAWRPGDVARVYEMLRDHGGLRIAATAEAPREGSTGERGLVPARDVDVVVHGAGVLSGARQGRRDGAHAALSPGTVDASPRLPETRAPSAGLLVIRGATWTWKPLVDEK